jgi:uncharacterized protein (TIGR03437 family)
VGAFGVTLSSSNGALTAPPSLNVPSGQSSATFQAIGGIVAQGVNIAIGAGAGSNTVQASIALSAGDAPTLTVPSQVAGTALSAVRFTAAALDAYGLPLTFSAAGLPSGATLNPSTGLFQWTPTSTQTGAFSFTITATDSAGLSASQSPVINVTSTQATVLGIYNSASFTLDKTCSPGSLATLVGWNLTDSPGAAPADASSWPTQLDGVQVLVNGSARPLLAVTNQLINFQCPTLTPGTSMTIAVQTTSALSPPPIPAMMAETTPGLFQVNAANQGAILIAGTNQIAMPATDAMPSRPAKIGEYLAIYANGLGPVAEAVAPGTAAPVDHTIATLDQVTVVIGGVEFMPSFAGLAPGLAGLYQINLGLTSDAQIGDAVPLYVKVTQSDGTVTMSNTVTVAIQAADPVATAAAVKR